MKKILLSILLVASSTLAQKAHAWNPQWDLDELRFQQQMAEIQRRHDQFMLECDLDDIKDALSKAKAEREDVLRAIKQAQDDED